MKRILNSVGAVCNEVYFLPFVAIFVLSLGLNGQNQANVWYFGVKTGLNFTGSGDPTILTDGPDMSGMTDEGEACTTISDQNGNMLFISDGDNVWDKNRAAMPNGNALAGSFTSTQGALVIPRPGSVLMAGGYPRYYYIFTIDAITGGGLGLRYSEVDMNLPGNGTAPAPLGDVVSATKNTLVQTGVVEGMLAVPHFNGTDTWIVVRGPGTGNTYYSALVSSSGVAAPVSSTAGQAPVGTSTYIMKINPCFNLLALTYHSNWNTSLGTVNKSDNYAEILRYDNSTGLVSDFSTGGARKIGGNGTSTFHQLTASNDYRGIYGIEWSPNGRYLFISELVDKELYQFDVYAGASGNFTGTIGTSTVASAADIMASKQTLGTGTTTRTGHVQMGPNGRIYTAQHTWGSGMSYVGEVANPNSFPATWNNTKYGWNNGTTSAWVCMGLPTLNKSFSAGTLTMNVTSPYCVGTAIPLSYTYIGTAASQTWSSTGGTFAASNTVVSPTVTYAASGSKTINLSVVDQGCGYTRTASKTVTVNDAVVADGSVSCSPRQGTVNSPNGSYTYVWYADAAMTQPMATGTTNVPLPIGGTGNVYLRAETSVTTATGSSILATSKTSPDNWNNPISGNILFTVNNTIVLNSFKFASGMITNGTTDLRNYSIAIQNSAGTVNYYNNTYVLDVYNSIKTQTVSPAVTLGPGTYRIVVTGPSNAGTWSAQSPSSTADNAVSITTNVAGLADFNYSYTKYTVTPAPCSTEDVISYNCPLPVSWLNFSGEKTEGGNLLTWSTASESNASHFEVQRSLDGLSFQSVGSVNARGTSFEISNYSFVDASASAGFVYYRLKQVDVDAKHSFSSTIVVGTSGASYSLLPNPGDGLVYLVGASADALISVSDLHGREILSASTNTGSIDLSAFAKGVYLIQVLEANQVQTLRYVKQ